MEDIAECAKLLALNIAHYQSKYGELSLDDRLSMLGMKHPNEQQLQLAASEMEVLVGVLGNIIMGLMNKRINHIWL